MHQPALAGCATTPTTRHICRHFFVFIQNVREHALVPIVADSICPHSRHCVTHQIRLILISAIVIASLSYPALPIYWSTPLYSRLVSTSNVLDSFLAEHVAFGSRAQHDLQHLWQGHHNLQLCEDEVAHARCRFDHTCFPCI